MEYTLILTDAGQSRIADAIAHSTQINLTQIAFGDSNGSYYEPTTSQTSLLHEVKRININNKSVDTQNSNRIIIEGFIPAADNGYQIREMGIFDNTGVMIAVKKYPFIDKINSTSGAVIDLYVKEYLTVTNTSAFNLTVDPSAIVATRTFVDQNYVKKSGDTMTNSLDFPDFGYNPGAAGQITIGKSLGWTTYNMLSHRWTPANGEYVEINVPSSATNAASLKFYYNGDLLIGNNKVFHEGNHSSLTDSQKILSASLGSDNLNNACSAGTGLSVNLTASSANPFKFCAACGYYQGNIFNIIKQIISNQVFSGLTPNSTNYLYISVNTGTGAISYNSTTIKPIYGIGTALRPTSPANGQLYFDYGAMCWYKYTNNSWNIDTNAYIFTAEADTNATAVTAVRNTMINQPPAQYILDTSTAWSPGGIYKAKFNCNVICYGGNGSNNDAFGNIYTGASAGAMTYIAGYGGFDANRLNAWAPVNAGNYWQANCSGDGGWGINVLIRLY